MVQSTNYNYCVFIYLINTTSHFIYRVTETVIGDIGQQMSMQIVEVNSTTL